MNKKLLLSIGTLGAVVAPVAAVVACGDKEEKVDPFKKQNDEIHNALQKDLGAVTAFTLAAPTGWAKDMYKAMSDAHDLSPELKIVTSGYIANVVMKPGLNGSNAAHMESYSTTNDKDTYLATSKYLYVAPDASKDGGYAYDKNNVDHVDFKPVTGLNLTYTDATMGGTVELFETPDTFISKVDGKFLWSQIPLTNLKTAFEKIKTDLNWQ